MSYILMLYIYANAIALMDRQLALTNAGEYKTLQDCETAGKESLKLVKYTMKNMRYACLKKG